MFLRPNALELHSMRSCAVLRRSQFRHASTAITQPRKNTPSKSSSDDETCDVLIVGTGAAGLVAALRAHYHGLKPLVIEKSAWIGGASAYSGGGIWIPNNHLSNAAGIKDSIPNALKYLETVIEDVGPVSSRERKMAFLTQGPEMISWLSKSGVKWRHTRGYPDYYPDKAGGVIGRSIEGEVFNLKKLGDWQDRLLNRPGSRDIALYCNEYQLLALFLSTWKSIGTIVQAVLWRTYARQLLGQKPVTMGKNLIAQLMLLCKNRGIVIWRESPLVELLVENHKVAGAVVHRRGTLMNVLANKGVLLCAGGFAQNTAMRQAYTDASISNKWTSVPPGDMGDAVKAGEKVGGALALMDEAWWGPTFIDPATDQRHFSVVERALPHSIIVDSQGERYMNEAQSYVDCGHAMFERDKEVSAIPSWFVFDSRHRKRYLLGSFLPGAAPEAALKSGFIVKAESVEELAEKTGINPQGLTTTVTHFNHMVTSRGGIDADFGRGRTAYDNNFGDPTRTPNPNLGTLEKAPYFAIKIWPGDLGTKGGLVTDEDARVVRGDGVPVRGLYAAGNTSASVMGRTYPGAGGTLGPAMTFAFVAVDHMAMVSKEKKAVST